MTSSPAVPGRVVVGVDGSAASRAAAQFGVDFASRHGVPIVMLNACAPPPRVPAAPTRDATIDRAAAIAVVNRVLSEVRVPTRLMVEVKAAPGSPAEVLSCHAEGAGLVVIGTHHLDLGEHGVPGGVGSTLGRTISCPLVVVPGIAPLGDVVPELVMVALDGETAAEAVLRFAFEEAAVRGVRLVVLHAESPRSRPADRRAAALDLEEILAGWRADYPDVPVGVFVFAGDPETVLTEASNRAALLVVGGPHRRAFGGWLRSVARAILDRSHCALVVVPG